jgi:hypothetical protein
MKRSLVTVGLALALMASLLAAARTRMLVQATVRPDSAAIVIHVVNSLPDTIDVEFTHAGQSDFLAFVRPSEGQLIVLPGAALVGIRSFMVFLVTRRDRVIVGHTDTVIRIDGFVTLVSGEAKELERPEARMPGARSE